MLLAYSWTPYAESVGGIDSSLNGFLRYAEQHWPGRIEVQSLGGRQGESPASPCATKIAIQPICSRRASPVPVNLRFLLSLWRNRPRRDGHAVLYLHRSDHALAYLADDRPPLVLYIHGSAEHLSLPNESKLRLLRAAMPFVERAAIRRSSHVFICSERGRKYYAQRYPRYARRFEVLPSAVDGDRFRLIGTEAARRALGIDQAVFLVLFAGRIEEVKDPLLWVNAFHQVCARLPDARGAILGSGAQAPEMLRMLECYGISNRLLCLKGVPEAELALWYNAADVLLLTSHFEGSPRVVVEALACGTPVVSTDVGDAPEMRACGAPLTICDSRDPMALAESVVEYIGHEKKCCPEFVESHSFATVFGRVLEVLKAAAEGTAGV
jgi:glycosyltransferase involved in cell wall biosynthesis